MINRRIFILTSSMLALTACSQKNDETIEEDNINATSEDGVLRVAMECAYAPYNWTTYEQTDFTAPIGNVPNAYADGYDVQIAKEIAGSLSMQLEIVKLSWDGLIGALDSGQADMIIAGMSDTPERRESINFSEPYIEDTVGVFVLKDSKWRDATCLNDLRGAYMIGQKDTLFDSAIDEIDGVNHLTPLETQPAVLDALASGACDAVTFPKMNEKGYLAQFPNFVSINFAENEGFETTNPASVGLPKDSLYLMQVNHIIDNLSDAERQEIWDSACARQPI